MTVAEIIRRGLQLYWKSNSIWLNLHRLEADSCGPTNVLAPAGGLLSNSNYFLEDGRNPHTGVTATINFTVDFVSSANGYSFQLTCYSTEGLASARLLMWKPSKLEL